MTDKPHLQILLCSPRGFCAGVDRAIQMVEVALERYGAPVYVRHQIVHNRFVVESLERRGAVFVKDLDEIPETGQPVIFSAHGVPKSVPERAESLNLFALDATCPLVTKVHKQVRLHHSRGLHVLMIGHAGHPEVVGTMGQLPSGAVTLIETVEDARTVAPQDAARLAFVTQTTLSVDDTAEIVEVLKARFPDIVGPLREDICYATTNRQEAVKAVAPRADAMIVVGAPNSSNSRRLVEVAQRAGCAKAHLVQRAGDIDWTSLEGAGTIGITAGASAPEVLVEEVIAALADHFDIDVKLVSTANEDVTFHLPARFATRPNKPDMAVYTDVSDDDIADLVARYDIGEPLSFRGIAEGVENTNYILHTDRAQFILTLYEKRVDPADLPFFMDLMGHLNGNGIACPAPVADREGKVLQTVADRPAAVFTFLEGLWVRRPHVRHCARLGDVLGRFHTVSRTFPGKRINALSIAGWAKLVDDCVGRADEVVAGLSGEIEAELDHLSRNWPDGLPIGVIHADLFPDNVFFIGDRVSGLIDFYFACTDMLAYDVAICLNAWCFEQDQSFNVTKGRALVEAYRAARPFEAGEFEALPVLSRGAAFRFLLTRLYDWVNTPAGALVKPKNPLEYWQKLRFHRTMASPKDYGL